MGHFEQTLSSETRFTGHIFTVTLDQVRLEDGTTAPREVVHHHGGASVLALTEQDEVYLVRQYRYAFSRVLTEIPAGKREPGEEPFVTAQRELREEIGATAGKWTELGALIASPGCYGEVLYLYMAQELTFGDTHPDEDEFLDVVRMPFDRAVELCMTGELTDAKTVVALLKGKLLR